ARVSLSFYDRPPAQVNADSIVMAVNRAYTPFPPMPETHFQASFGHLDGYSAIYYTYMRSKVIAKDLFSGFDQRNLLARATTRRWWRGPRREATGSPSSRSVARRPLTVSPSAYWAAHSASTRGRNG